MKKKLLYLISISLLCSVFVGCSKDESFDNKIYINSTIKTRNILLGSDDTDFSTFNVTMPKTEDKDITFTIKADPSLYKKYNEAYYDDAEALPEKYYSISHSEITIPAGNVLSSDITVSFSGLTQINRQEKFVLPVTINSNEIGVLASAQTMYFVIKSGSLINVVADIEENNVYIDWKDNSDFTAMRQFTAEALIRVRNFDRTLTTIMGIEGKFLIRIGDSSIPPNQLQIASGKNYTDDALTIPTNEWTHVAVTYDADAKEINVFINGRNLYTSTEADEGTINWGVPHSDESDGKPRCFWIGYSYNNDRYLAGEISECRVWNRVLTSAEINEEDHFYFVEPSSAGLIAYWKFNDGGGNTVKDHSAKGNDATASYDLKWNSVELPVE